MLLIIFPLIKAVHWGCLRQLFKEHLDKRTPLVAHVVKNLPAMQETRLHLWIGKIPWRREWLLTPVF